MNEITERILAIETELRTLKDNRCDKKITCQYCEFYTRYDDFYACVFTELLKKLEDLNYDIFMKQKEIIK